MKTLSYPKLWKKLTALYDEGEAKAIARMVYEVRYGLSFSDLLMGRDADVPRQELEEIAGRLLQHEPVQYVLGEAEFCGRRFHVAPGVLIPRPETEGLVRLAMPAAAQGGGGQQARILDIGTGSGCIAVTLAAELPEAQVAAWDISEQALTIAKGNARRHHASVDFQQVNVLTVPFSPLTSHLSLIVSNPPYICNKEREAMERNVLDYEPQLALFVPDDDPLLFYRTIGQLARHALRPDGLLAMEINSAYGQETCRLMSDLGFSHVALHQDQYDNDRFVTASI